jgi:hypothetical protein
VGEIGISIEDYAIALVDELMIPQHRRQQFSGSIESGRNGGEFLGICAGRYIDLPFWRK